MAKPERFRSSVTLKLMMVSAVFLIVPALLYGRFEQADAERKALMVTNLQVQGRLAAQALQEKLIAAGPRAPAMAQDLVDSVSRGELRFLFIRKRAGGSLGRTFAEFEPRTRAVDGLSIDFQPCADFAEHLLFAFGDRAIGFWTNVQQHRPVFADDVHEFIDDFSGVLVNMVGDVAPGIARDRSAGLPEVRLNIRRRTAFHVEHTRAARERNAFPFLEVDGDLLLPLNAAVVIIRREGLQIRMKHRLTNPPIEVEDFGPVLVHDFARAQQPVVEELFGGRFGLGLGRALVDG